MYFEIITDKDVFIVLSKLILMNRYIFHKVKVLISSYFAMFSLEEFAIPSKNHCLSFCAINGMYICQALSHVIILCLVSFYPDKK